MVTRTRTAVERLIGEDVIVWSGTVGQWRLTFWLITGLCWHYMDAAVSARPWTRIDVAGGFPGGQPQSSATTDAMATKQQFNINEASKLCCLSALVLRIWELRYHWPKPARKANGYRTYEATLIKDLQWAAGRIADGKVISELIIDGELVRDDPPPRKKPAPGAGLDFSAIAQPTTPEGRRLRERLETAIRAGDDGQIALVKSMAARLRPAEREAAVTAVLRLASEIR